MYALTCVLERARFEWMELPRRREARLAVTFDPCSAASPRRWCSRRGPARSALSRVYLLALATAAREGTLAPVRAGEPDHYYRQLLGLEPARPAPRQALVEDTAEALEDEFLGPPMQRRRLELASAPALDDEIELSADGDEESHAEDATSNGDATPANAEAGANPAPAETPADQPVARSSSSSGPPPPQPPPPPSLPEQPPSERRFTRPSDLNHNWGVFRFTLRATKPSRPGLPVAFAWQCACTFHIKSAQTGCKKSMAVRGDPSEWDAQSALVIQCLRHWACQAPEYTSQATHLSFDPDPQALPPPAVLEAQRPNQGLEEPPPSGTAPPANATPSATCSSSPLASASSGSTGGRSSSPSSSTSSRSS